MLSDHLVLSVCIRLPRLDNSWTLASFLVLFGNITCVHDYRKTLDVAVVLYISILRYEFCVLFKMVPDDRLGTFHA